MTKCVHCNEEIAENDPLGEGKVVAGEMLHSPWHVYLRTKYLAEAGDKGAQGRLKKAQDDAEDQANLTLEVSRARRKF